MSGGHAHHHDASERNSRRLTATLLLVATYMVAEVIGGLLSNSLALLADAGHMLSDAGALFVAVVAMRIGRRPPSATHTFGYRRAEILAALANGVLLASIAVYIGYHAIHRMASPPPIRGPIMLGVAAGGLVVNLASLFILHGGKSDNLNVRGAWLHVVADLLGSIGAMTSGALVALFGWHLADPIASLVITILVTYSAWMLLKQATAVLMEAVPHGIDIDSVERALKSIDGVVDVHDLHLWSVTNERPVMSAHIAVSPDANRRQLMERIRRDLEDQFDVHHTTIQLDCPKTCQPCAPRCAD